LSKIRLRKVAHEGDVRFVFPFKILDVEALDDDLHHC
jgi:hypothetical protein